MAVEEKTDSTVDEIEWNVDTEVQLFYAMYGHKPVGVNKYFQMACIYEKFRNSVNKDITSKVIWDHLDTMYDMQALDNPLVPSSRVKQYKKMGPTGCPKRVTNYHLSTLRKITEERRHHLTHIIIILSTPSMHQFGYMLNSVMLAVLRSREQFGNVEKDDTESLPFPNDEREFSLPEADFASMMEEKLKQEKPEGVVEPDVETKYEQKKDFGKHVKEVTKKESNKDVKENSHKKDSKESKDISKDRKDKEATKEPKKISGRDVKEGRRESKDGKEGKRDNKKDMKEFTKEAKKEPTESKDTKPVKSRGSIKEKKELKKEEEKEESLATYINSVKRERVRELSESKSDDYSPKRGAKRSTRGSLKSDDTSSNKSSSPVTTPTPPPSKRRRT